MDSLAQPTTPTRAAWQFVRTIHEPELMASPGGFRGVVGTSPRIGEQFCCRSLHKRADTALQCAEVTVRRLNRAVAR